MYIGAYVRTYVHHGCFSLAFIIVHFIYLHLPTVRIPLSIHFTLRLI